MPSCAVKKSATITLKTMPTREVTKKATRIATSEDFLGVKNKKNNVNKKTNTSRLNKKNEEYILNNKSKAKKIEKPSEMKLKKPKNVAKAHEIARQKAKVKEMFKNIFVISTIFGMLFLICYRYSCINEAFNEVNDIKEDLRKKQTINAQIESNIQKETDLAYIENYAKYQLGMQKPKDSQIKTINVKKQDKITTPIEIKEEVEESFFERLLDKFLNLFD